MGQSSNGNVGIRLAVDRDWPEISRISREVSQEGIISDYINDIGKRYMEIGKVYVAENERIVGFQHVQDVGDGSIYLSGLRITREYRGKGIASALVEKAALDASDNGKTIARAYVEPENTASMALMAKFGFRKAVRVSIYFGSIDDSVFTEEKEWPDCYIDLGHVPARPHESAKATLLRKGNCLISRADSNKWDNKPSYAILNSEGCQFLKGRQFMVATGLMRPEDTGGLVSVSGFEKAILFELDLGEHFSRMH